MDLSDWPQHPQVFLVSNWDGWWSSSGSGLVFHHPLPRVWLGPSFANKQCWGPMAVLGPVLDLSHNKSLSEITKPHEFLSNIDYPSLDFELSWLLHKIYKEGWSGAWLNNYSFQLYSPLYKKTQVPFLGNNRPPEFLNHVNPVKEWISPAQMYYHKLLHLQGRSRPRSSLNLNLQFALLLKSLFQKMFFCAWIIFRERPTLQTKLQCAADTMTTSLELGPTHRVE